MNPEEFITLGEAIIKDESYDSEARRRTAIGRIYYGLLHHIRLIKRLTHIDTKYFHTELIDNINDIDTRLGNLLVNMKELRTKADYYLNIKPDLDSFLKIHRRIKKRLDITDVT